MSSLSRFWSLCMVLTLALVAPVALAEPVRIIFDTDMDSDCDDAGALAMLHALADAGEATILATPVSSASDGAAHCTAALNAYFGRPELPIGVPHRPGASRQRSRFAERIAQEFPQQLPPWAELPDATEIYRRILAGQPDGSVLIVTVGDLTNLRHLLETPADDLSPLDGRALVERKVQRWVCMGSRYPADLDPARWGNFKMDPESTVKAIVAWPTPLTFTGGGAFAESVATGAGLSALPAESPVRRVYELYFGGPPHNRHSADQIAVMVAVRGAGFPWKVSRGGSNHIFPDGRHAWESTPDNPRQEYVSQLAEGADAKEVARSMEELMRHLPPAKTQPAR